MTDKDSVIGNKEHLYAKYGIVVNVVPAVGVFLSGPFFLNRELMQQFIPKYVYILDTIKNAKSKVLIYHNVVCSNTGVFAIRELLKINGYAEYDLNTGATKGVTDITMCNWCQI